MSEKREVEVTGDEYETYITASSSDIEWPEEGTIIVGDHDITVGKSMGRKLMGYLSLSSKLQKMLVGTKDNESWSKFKTVFESTARNLNMTVKFKVSHGNLVGVMNPGFDTRSLTQLKNWLNECLHADRKLKAVYSDLDSHDDVVVVLAHTNSAQVEFLGQQWRTGAIFAYSTTGLYGPSFAPAIIPLDNSAACYSFPTSMEELVVVPDSFVALEEAGPKNLSEIVKSCANSMAAGTIGRWTGASRKALSVIEFETLMRAFLVDSDTQGEQQMLSRLAQIYEAHGAAVEGKPSRDWLKTAWSGTTGAELLEKALSVPVDVIYHCYPAYTVGHMFDGEFNLDKVANNRLPALEKLTWETN